MEPLLINSYSTKYTLDSLGLIMDPKYVSLCIFVLLVLHGDTTLAGVFPSLKFYIGSLIYFVYITLLSCYCYKFDVCFIIIKLHCYFLLMCRYIYCRNLQGVC
jgi:hypothetical protein